MLLSWIRTPALCLVVVVTSFPALAQRWFRESFDPYNLVCQISGELGAMRLMFHVEDVTAKLIYFPTITLGGKPLAVESFDSNNVKGTLEGGVPGLDPRISTADFRIDRNTGAIDAHFYETWQTTPATATLPPVRFRLTHTASGTCIKAAQVF